MTQLLELAHAFAGMCGISASEHGPDLLASMLVRLSTAAEFLNTRVDAPSLQALWCSRQ